MSDAEWEAVTVDTITVSSDQIEEFATLFAYMGYDPEHTFELLKGYARAAGKTPDNFRAHMAVFAMWYITRGTTSDKGLLRSTAEAKATMDPLKKLYKVIPDKKTPSSRDEISIGRIVGCIPHVIASTLRKINEKDVRIVGDKPASLPWWLAFPSAPALFPKTEAFEGLWIRWKTWALQFDRVVNGDRADADRALKYADVCRNSKLFSDEVRLGFLMAMAGASSEAALYAMRGFTPATDLEVTALTTVHSLPPPPVKTNSKGPVAATSRLLDVTDVGGSEGGGIRIRGGKGKQG